MQNNGKKSSGLRILWIPGSRKRHPKGRYDATNKTVSHKGGQKKSEIWSMGGTKAQKDLLNADPDSALLDGPSVSGSTVANLARTAATVAPLALASGEIGEVCLRPPTTDAVVAVTTIESKPSAEHLYSSPQSPRTPNSSTSTEPLQSPPQSPAKNGVESETETMPGKTITTAPIVITTPPDVHENNRFALLERDIQDDVDIYGLPILQKRDLLLDSSAGTTVSTATTPSPSASPSGGKSDSGSPSKGRSHRNHNNNHQGDLNSIESISEKMHIPSSDVDSADKLALEPGHTEAMANDNTPTLKKGKHKRKHHAKAKELDQLDGLAVKPSAREPSIDEDEKVVKCLYYTLMCCDCTIS